MIANQLCSKPRLVKYSKYFFSFHFQYQDKQYIIFHACGALVNYQFVKKNLQQDQFLKEDIDIHLSVEAQKLQKIIEKNKKYILNSEIFIATDNDRAGELIGWTIIELIQNIIKPTKLGLSVNIQQLPSCRQQFNICIKSCKNIPAKDINQYIFVQRVRFNQLDKETILQALKNPVPFNHSAIDAEDLRSEIDLRIGYTFTNFQRKYRNQLLENENRDNYKTPFTFGTCQIPTLGICLYEGNKQSCKIQQFKTEVHTKQINNPLVSPQSFKSQQIILAQILSQKKQLNVIQTRNVKQEYPPNPLNTIRLQQHFNKYTAQQVLKAAETLYCQGYITYPRTETEKFNYVNVFDIIQHLRKFKYCKNQIQYLNNLCNQPGYQQQIQSQIQRVNKNNNLQDDNSHTFLYVLKDINQENKLTICEKDVYEYILTHFIATISENSITTTIQYKATQKDNKIPFELSTSQTYLTTAGWKEILYGKTSQEIPNQLNQQNQSYVQIDQIQINQVQQQQQKFYQSDLINYMDRYRIGTDATIAGHIEKIKDRKYIDNNFNPTPRGKILADFYSKINYNFVSPTFRAMMEQMLKRVEYNLDSRQNIKNILIQDAQQLYLQCIQKLNK